MLALTMVVLAPGWAHASDDDDNPPWSFNRPRTELGFGMLVGGFEVGPVGGAAVGVHLDAGRRIGPLMLLGEYNFMGIGESSPEKADPIRGHLHRFGVAARYSFAEFGGGRYTPIRGGFWLEAGLGHQKVAWNEGGILDRQDLSLGFGAEIDIRQGHEKPRFWSIYYAFRTTIAKTPGGKATGEPICGGPCDEPTFPSPYDLGLFFNMGFTFGR
jgi:hypothetical protein